MCLLTFMPKNVNLDYERALVSAKANPDGFGFAIHAGIAIIKDHDMDFEKLWMRWSDLRTMYKGPAMFHFRIATHGYVDINNCHPFDVGDNPKSVIGHNGILPLTMPINEKRSDTKLFAEIVLPHIGGVKALDDNDTFKEIGNWASGNKMVILSVDEDTKHDWYIVNESLGHWKDEIWWSNSSYVRSYPTGYTNYGYPSSPYLGKSHSGYNDILNDDDFDDDWANGNFSFRDKLEREYLEEIGWNKTDQWEYLEDELYPDLAILNKIRTFTDFSQVNVATITCYACGAVFITDPLEPSSTHCGECKSCLNCSKATETPGECDCWDNYDYGQSFISYETTENTRDDITATDTETRINTIWDSQS